MIVVVEGKRVEWGEGGLVCLWLRCGRIGDGELVGGLGGSMGDGDLMARTVRGVESCCFEGSEMES